MPGADLCCAITRDLADKKTEMDREIRVFRARFRRQIFSQGMISILDRWNGPNVKVCRMSTLAADAVGRRPGPERRSAAGALRHTHSHIHKPASKLSKNNYQSTLTQTQQSMLRIRRNRALGKRGGWPHTQTGDRRAQVRGGVLRHRRDDCDAAAPSPKQQPQVDRLLFTTLVRRCSKKIEVVGSRVYFGRPGECVRAPASVVGLRRPTNSHRRRRRPPSATKLHTEPIDSRSSSIPYK